MRSGAHTPPQSNSQSRGWWTYGVERLKRVPLRLDQLSTETLPLALT